MSEIKAKLELTEVAFGAHFIAELTLDQNLGNAYYRKLSKDSDNLFTNKIIRQGMPFLYVNPSTDTQLLLTPRNLTFTVRLYENQEQFRTHSRKIVELLTQIFEAQEANLRVVGKVYRYALTHPEALKSLRNLVPSFGAAAYLLKVRPTLRDGTTNIHLQLQSAEEERKPLEDTVLVECDINNADQDVPHGPAFVEDVINFADNFVGQRLKPLLSEKLGFSVES